MVAKVILEPGGFIDNPAKGATPSKPAAEVPTGAAADDLLNGVV